MSNSSAEFREKERALEALLFRAAEAKKAMRELTGRMAMGLKEVEVLLGLLPVASASAEATARHWVAKEQTTQQLAERLAQAARHVRFLEAGLRGKDHMLSQSEDKMARLEQEENSANAALAQIYRSRSWRLAQALRRARLRWLPPGSLRARLARLGVRTVRTWRHEGLLAVGHKGTRKVLRKLARIVRAWGTAVRLLPPVVGPPAESAHRDKKEVLPQARADPNLILAAANALATSGDAPLFHIDEFLQLDERSFFVKGWIWGESAGEARLAALAPHGARASLDDLYRYARPDIFEHFGVALHDRRDARPAFISFFQTEEPARSGPGWAIECRGESGAKSRVSAAPTAPDLVQARGNVLAALHLRGGNRELLLAKHIAPALQCLQACLASPDVTRVEQYGAPPSAPVATVVVPLYGRIDFLEHQLAQFVHDPEFRRTDLIYVLDSPELGDALLTRALQLSRLYPVPFRTVHLRHNVGYAGANRAGFDLARGHLLVLLNSDVLPDRPGWLGDMAAFYLKTPRIGALGPKLVYEDETLQHAGMFFARRQGSAVWENEHYYKGMHRGFPSANRTRPVPAVTGACMMVQRDRYQEVGGLLNRFVQGDFEDSELCLRLREHGYDNWYLADCELYHLEGQSYPGSLRAQCYEYNSWLQTHLWGARIEALMDGFAAENPPRRLAA